MKSNMDNGFTSDKIMGVITEIRNDISRSGVNKERYYKMKHEEFFKKFPKLFFAALDDKFDLRFLSLMLKQRDDIIQTSDVQVMEQASQDINEKLNEQYIYPVIPKEEIEKMKTKMAAQMNNAAAPAPV